MKKHWAHNYLLSAQWRLWSDWALTWVCWAHVMLLVLSCGGSHYWITYWHSSQRTPPWTAVTSGPEKVRNQFAHDKTNKMTCAPSEDSDQSGHAPSLISIHYALYGELRTRFFMWTVKTLIRLGGCPGGSESSLGAQFILLVLLWTGSNAIWDESGGKGPYHCAVSDPLNIMRSARSHSSSQAYSIIWAATWQNQQSDCAPSEDSDQPGHPPSLIRVFAVRMKKTWVLSYTMSAQQSLWSDWANAQADLSLCWAHTHFVGFVMSWLNYNVCLWTMKAIPSEWMCRVIWAIAVHLCTLFIFSSQQNVIKSRPFPFTSDTAQITLKWN